jgi:hypothetical protein
MQKPHSKKIGTVQMRSPIFFETGAISFVLWHYADPASNGTNLKKRTNSRTKIHQRKRKMRKVKLTFILQLGNARVGG